MSGKHGGLQAKLNEFLGEEIYAIYHYIPRMPIYLTEEIFHHSIDHQYRMSTKLLSIIDIEPTTKQKGGTIVFPNHPSIWILI